jgi:ubiquitin-protein ligase
VTGSGFVLDSRWPVAWAVETVFFSVLFLLSAPFLVGRRDKDE